MDVSAIEMDVSAMESGWVLFLYNNQLTGSIPAALGKRKNLIYAA